MASSKFSDVDEYGFKRSEDFDYLEYGRIMDKYYKVLAIRQMKWDRSISRRTNEPQMSQRTMKRFIRKGIPNNLRGKVWYRVSGAAKAHLANPNLYRTILNENRFDPTVVETIKIDLPRTYPDNIYFETMQGQLFNILAAYSVHNPEVGYCQGLNYIAGLILIVTKNEEWTFWLLKVLIEDIISKYHTRNMSGLIRDISVLRELLITKAPRTNQKLEELGLPCAVLTTKWFICLFAEVLPTETVLRIWDCLFNEGYKIIFRVSLTLILAHQNEINGCDDISALASLFRDKLKSPGLIDCHEFIKSIFVVPGKLQRRTIEELRKRYEVNASQPSPPPVVTR